MSKKKVFSGSTMTLKDFHGGSIPSDVSLPSAPGLIVRPTGRPIFDCQNVSGNSTGAGRSDHRLRPHSSSSVRNLDDSKTPFLSSSVNIGRNFDEDERKPLGGGGPPPPHRTVSDESFGGSAMLLEPRVDNRKISVQSNLGPVGAQIGGISESSYSSRVVEGGQSGVGVSSRPNVSGARKEANGVGEFVSSTRSRQSLVSEFAQASALDKISSGRWQTKPVQNMVEVEVIRPLESPNSFYGWEKDSYVDGGVSFMSKRCLGIEVNRGSFKEMHSGGDIVHSPAQNSVLFTNEGQPASPATFGASELPQPPEVSERPKLKLLPRTKLLEVQEAHVVVHSQGSQQQIDTIHSKAASVFENPRHVIAKPSSSEATHRKPGISGSEAEQRAVERPKLNLKPRSQPVNHSDESTDIERKALFGGARPREMVLKERGVDDVVTSYDKAQAPSRIKNNAPRSEVIPAHPNTSHQSERVNNLSIDQRIGRGHEKRDQRGILHRFDLQRKNWHNDNRRDGRDTEKHQQERQPSPETWRKPVEPPNSYNSGLRFGKAVSAVDLVQAFSRSVSSPKPVDQFSSQNGLSGQKGLPACSLVPFSRLTGPTSRAQINGY